MPYRKRAATLILSVFSACSIPSRLPQPDVSEISAPEQVTAIAFDRSGEKLWFSHRTATGCELIEFSVKEKATRDQRTLSFCPDRLSFATDGSILARSHNFSVWLDEGGNEVAVAGLLVDAISRQNFLVKTDGRIWWQTGGERVPLAHGLRNPRILSRSEGVLAIQKGAAGESLVVLTRHDVRSVTPELRAIDSFDVSPDEKEIVLSALAENGYDVGLVSSAGGDIRWVFPDPLAERTVKWAPRGNKISYVVEASGGAIVRTVHVPTAFQLSVDFPLSAISTIAWEPKAEKFAVVVSSLHRSPWIELLRYGGEEREVLFGGATRVQGEFDRIGDAIILTPAVTRYDRRYPLVVWVTDDNPFEWNGTRNVLHRSAEVGSVIVPERGAGDRMWNALQAIPWIDKDRVFVVYSGATRGPQLPQTWSVTVIAPASARLGLRRGRHKIVTAPARSVGTIELFATPFIEGRLNQRNDRRQH